MGHITGSFGEFGDVYELVGCTQCHYADVMSLFCLHYGRQVPHDVCTAASLTRSNSLCSLPPHSRYTPSLTDYFARTNIHAYALAYLHTYTRMPADLSARLLCRRFP